MASIGIYELAIVIALLFRATNGAICDCQLRGNYKETETQILPPCEYMPAYTDSYNPPECGYRVCLPDFECDTCIKKPQIIEYGASCIPRLPNLPVQIESSAVQYPTCSGKQYGYEINTPQQQQYICQPLLNLPPASIEMPLTKQPTYERYTYPYCIQTPPQAQPTSLNQNVGYNIESPKVQITPSYCNLKGTIDCVLVPRPCPCQCPEELKKCAQCQCRPPPYPPCPPSLQCIPCLQCSSYPPRPPCPPCSPQSQPCVIQGSQQYIPYSSSQPCEYQQEYQCR